MPQGNKTRTPLSRHMGEVARQARKKAELTQEDVADRIGLAAEVYGRFERGYMLPSVPTLVRMCRVLRLDANVVLGFSSKQVPTWVDQSLPEGGDPPAVRRLLRTVRQLSRRQLWALAIMANTLLLGGKTER
ncbi:MAG: helix-turn-helix domain-containing protein [Archangium sp.]